MARTGITQYKPRMNRNSRMASESERTVSLSEDSMSDTAECDRADGSEFDHEESLSDSHSDADDTVTAKRKRKYTRHKKETLAARLRRYIVETASSDCLSTDGKALTCTACECSVGFGQISQVRDHLGTKKHDDSKRRKTKREDESTLRQQLLSQTVNTMRANAVNSNQFYIDTAAAFAAADIPLHKLSVPTFKRYLEKYTGKHIPNESTVRKHYVETAYLTVVEKIRAALNDHYIFIQVDETQLHGHKVAHLLVGKLDSNGPGTAFLLACEVLPRTNSETVAQFLNESLRILWPARVEYNRILLLISDAAAYMKATYNSLKVLYPKMIHITCLAHGLHNICEKVRYAFPTVNALISDGKSVFVKAPNRVSYLKTATQLQQIIANNRRFMQIMKIMLQIMFRCR